MWGLGYRAYIRDAAALHALNDHEADGAQHPAYVGVKLPDVVEVIPNGIFPAMLESQTEKATVNALVPSLGDAPYILYLARLHPGKGCDLLGEAFVKVASARPDVHLVMVGQDQGGRAMVEGPVQRAGLSGRVHFTGPVFDARKHALYRHAAAYCLPSRHEGFSMAITEAMAWGCPVVATRTCYFPELTAEGCGVEVDLCADQLADALLDLLGDSVAAKAMGQRGRELVLACYTWPKIAERTVGLYRRCLEAN